MPRSVGAIIASLGLSFTLTLGDVWVQFGLVPATDRVCGQSMLLIGEA